MIIERPADARGLVDMGWLRSRHTFSFGHYHDPAWMGFGALRVINDDTVAAGGGFSPHRHANMEILSVVLEGALAHKDSSGNQGVIGAGDVQWMSAGHGIEHSEFNASEADPVHFLQLWIQPDRLNAAPAYGQRHFAPAARRQRWVVLASPDGVADADADRDGAAEPAPLPIRQQAFLRATRLHAGDTIAAPLDPARRYWLHVATGSVAVGERVSGAGDALGYVDETGSIPLRGIDAHSDVLLFDLPA